MQMEIEAAGDRLTARIKGELDHHSAAQARAQLEKNGSPAACAPVSPAFT